MISNVKLAKVFVTQLDDGRQCVFLRTRHPAWRAHSQSDGYGVRLFYTHSRTLDAAVSIQNLGATLQAQPVA